MERRIVCVLGTILCCFVANSRVAGASLPEKEIVFPKIEAIKKEILIPEIAGINQAELETFFGNEAIQFPINKNSASSVSSSSSSISSSSSSSGSVKGSSSYKTKTVTSKINDKGETVVTVDEKTVIAGVCPKVEFKILLFDDGPACSHACQDDADCEGEAQKCCYSPKGCKYCWGPKNPVPEKPEPVITLPVIPFPEVPRPGSCRLFPIPMYRIPKSFKRIDKKFGFPLCESKCERDSDCKGRKKCCIGINGCKQCLNAYRPPVKPVVGLCPIQNDIFWKPACSDKCETDRHCARTGMKCCRTGNGCRQCVEPEPIPAPPVFFDQGTCDNRVCPEGEKCRYVKPCGNGDCPTKTFCTAKQTRNPCGDSIGPIMKLDSSNRRVILTCGKDSDCGKDGYCDSRLMDVAAVCCKKSACAQPKVVGPCRASFGRYFYDSTTGRCQKFTYGGCKGNENNFESMEACTKQCGAEPVKPVEPPIPPPPVLIEQNTCATVKCGEGKHCRLIRPCEDCDSINAICTTLKSRDPCRNNNGPLIHIEYSGKESVLTCGKDTDCPSKAYCNYDLMDVASVCCKGTGSPLIPDPNPKPVEPKPEPKPLPIVFPPLIDPPQPQILPAIEPPIIVKEGMCPEYEQFYFADVSKCNNRCSRDRDCLGDHKCCKGGDLCLRCTKPDKPLPPVLKKDTDDCKNVHCPEGQHCRLLKCDKKDDCAIHAFCTTKRKTGQCHGDVNDAILYLKGDKQVTMTCGSSKDCPKGTMCNSEFPHQLADVSSKCCKKSDNWNGTQG